MLDLRALGDLASTRRRLMPSWRAAATTASA
jgi:hypothetical protein